MKGLIAVAVLIVGSVIALQGGSDSSAQSQDSSQLEQGMAHVDSVLRQGLSESAHDKISEQADQSAEWLRGYAEKFKTVAE